MTDEHDNRPPGTAHHAKPGTRHAGMFKPGVSGNPGGAKKLDPDVRKAFQELTPFAVQKLFELLECKQPAVQLAAAREILDRNLGKPRVGVELSGPNQTPMQMITADMTPAQAAAAYAASLGGEHASSMIAEEVINGHDEGAS